ncbi:hypothetical protein [Halovulum sp. GXIMD14793]
MPFRLSKNDSSDIGFALSCLQSGAIQFGKFKEWLYHVIEHAEEPPSYIFDMLDVGKQVDFKAFRIMGFVASGQLTDQQCDALEGIGFLRGIRDFEDQVSREDAIAAFRADPEFETRVRLFFPFLDMDAVVGPDPDKGF